MTERIEADTEASVADTGNVSPSADASGSETTAMTVESPPSTPGSTVNENSGSDKQSPSGRGAMRTTSSKFASIRAAFEQGPPADGAADGMKRRAGPSSRGSESTENKREYEAEIARLKDELEKEKELRIAYEEKVTGMEEEIEELSSQLEERDEAWREEYERRALQERSEAEERLHMMQNEVRSQRQETSTLQQQLSELKRSVSASTRITTEVSDSTFRQEIDILQHEVQNWVVNNFRRIKVEVSGDDLCKKLEQVTEPEQFERLQPIYSAFDSAVKIPIYQATVACYLMEIFDEPYLFGLYGKVDWSKRARQMADSFAGVLEPATYNRWRAMTFDNLRQAPKFNELVESAIHGIAEMICITLTAVTEVEESETRFASLKTIIKRAVSLAHLIRVQQSQYEFVFPTPGEHFDASCMEDISDEIDSDDERTLRFVTFPYIIKKIDDAGNNLDERNLVVKARVLCNDDGEG